jgi:hypothetical protein
MIAHQGDVILIYLIAAGFGFSTGGWFAWAFEAAGEAVQMAAIAGSLIGGVMGVAVIGPAAQTAWRAAFDENITAADLTWPSPISLWYSAWMPSALIGGLVFGFIGAVIARQLANR